VNGIKPAERMGNNGCPQQAKALVKKNYYSLKV